MSSNGENPKLFSGASRYANRSTPRYLSQSFGFSTQIFLSIDFKVPLNSSTNPLHIGWYGLVVNCRTSFKRSEVNWGPWSDKISLRTPTREHISISASAPPSLQWSILRVVNGVLILSYRDPSSLLFLPPPTHFRCPCSPAVVSASLLAPTRYRYPLPNVLPDVLSRLSPITAVFTHREVDMMLVRRQYTRNSHVHISKRLSLKLAHFC